MSASLLRPETSYLAVVGRVLAILRKHRGLGQGSFANKIGLSQSALSRIENGETGLTVQQLDKMSRTLDLETSDVIRIIDRSIHEVQNRGIKVDRENTSRNIGQFIATISNPALEELAKAVVTSELGAE